MDTLAVLLRIKTLLQATGSFGLVLISAGIGKETLGSQVRYPFVMLTPGPMTVDDEAEDLFESSFTVSMVQRIANDPWGETALIGAGVVSDAPSGLGILGLERILFDTIKLLTVQNSVRIQSTGSSGASAAMDPDSSYIASRDYTFVAWTGVGTSP